MDPDLWEFANEQFMRGQRHRLVNIQRRKPVHSHSLQNQIPLSEKERQEYKEEIKKLELDNSLLRSELHNHERDRDEFEFHLVSLLERLKNLQSRQRKLTSSVKVVLSEFGVHGKKRRFLEENHFAYETDAEISKQNGNSLPILDLEQVKKLEISLRMWENFLHLLGNSMKQQISISEPSYMSFPLIDSDPEDLRFLPPSQRDNTSSSSPQNPSANHVSDIPDVLSSMHLDTDTRTPYCSTGNIKYASSNETDNAFRPAENDHFWEQFLTENPGGFDPQELPSEMAT